MAYRKGFLEHIGKLKEFYKERRSGSKESFPEYQQRKYGGSGGGGGSAPKEEKLVQIPKEPIKEAQLETIKQLDIQRQQERKAQQAQAYIHDVGIRTATRRTGLPLEAPGVPDKEEKIYPVEWTYGPASATVEAKKPESYKAQYKPYSPATIKKEFFQEGAVKGVQKITDEVAGLHHVQKRQLGKWTERHVQIGPLVEPVARLGIGAGGFVTSIPSMLAHPVRTVKSIGKAVINPGETLIKVGVHAAKDPLGFAGGLIGIYFTGKVFGKIYHKLKTKYVARKEAKLGKMYEVDKLKKIELVEGKVVRMKEGKPQLLTEKELILDITKQKQFFKQKPYVQKYTKVRYTQFEQTTPSHLGKFKITKGTGDFFVPSKALELKGTIFRSQAKKLLKEEQIFIFEEPSRFQLAGKPGKYLDIPYQKILEKGDFSLQYAPVAIGEKEYFSLTYGGKKAVIQTKYITAVPIETKLKQIGYTPPIKELSATEKLFLEKYYPEILMVKPGSLSKAIEETQYLRGMKSITDTEIIIRAVPIETKIITSKAVLLVAAAPLIDTISKAKGDVVLKTKAVLKTRTIPEVISITKTVPKIVADVKTYPSLGLKTPTVTKQAPVSMIKTIPLLETKVVTKQVPKPITKVGPIFKEPEPFLFQFFPEPAPRKREAAPTVPRRRSRLFDFGIKPLADLGSITFTELLTGSKAHHPKPTPTIRAEFGLFMKGFSQSFPTFEMRQSKKKKKKRKRFIL